MNARSDNYYRAKGRKPPPRAWRGGQKKDINKNREYLLLFLFFLFCYYFFLNYSVIRVSGNSMRPTLLDGSYYLAAKINYNHNVVNGEILCAQTDDGLVIKRVLGTPGDFIKIETNGKIYRNSSYIGWINYRPLNVKLGEYYLLSGDNREESETYFSPRSNLFLKPLFID